MAPALLLATAAAVSSSAGSALQTPSNSFRPGEPWLDTNGDAIRAHSGGLLAVTDPKSPSTAPVYYWYGSDSYPGGAATLILRLQPERVKASAALPAQRCVDRAERGRILRESDENMASPEQIRCILYLK